MRGKGFNPKQYYGQQRSKSAHPHKNQQEIYFLLHSPHHVAVRIPYAVLTSALKTVLKNKQGFWSTQARAWLIPRQRLKECQAAVRHYLEHSGEKEDCQVRGIPDFVLMAETSLPEQLKIQSHITSIRSITYNPMHAQLDPRDMPFYERLYDFQKESLEWGIRKQGRLLLADEMGVGKTIQSLAIASMYRHEWPFLVVCPSSLRLNWQQEILHWMQDLVSKADVQVYAKGGATVSPKAQAVIVSYDLAWRFIGHFDRFRVVIADESHYLKNSSSKRCEALKPFLTTRKRVLLLTGTPALARPREIYNLLSIVRPDVFFNFKEFGSRYCEPTFNHFNRQVEYNGCQNSTELHYLLKDRVMLRRLKKDVLADLPDKQRQRVIVETDKSKMKELTALLKEGPQRGYQSMERFVMEELFNFNEDRQGGEGSDTMRSAYLLTAQAKMPAVKEYIKEMLENDIKLIVFGHHQHTLDEIQSMLEKNSIGFMRIDGKVNPEARHENVNLFQEKPSVKVALLSITAAGVGLTLTAASTVIFAELHWTPGVMVQAEDRAHRIGQKNSVNCHYLVAQGTIDDILYPYLLKKVTNVSSFVEGREATLNVQRMRKGEKGKVSKGDGDSSTFTRPEPPKQILTVFDPVQRYGNGHIDETQFTQNTDISEEIEASKCTPLSRRRLPLNLQVIVSDCKEGSEEGSGAKREEYIVPQVEKRYHEPVKFDSFDDLNGNTGSVLGQGEESDSQTETQPAHSVTQ